MTPDPIALPIDVWFAEFVAELREMIPRSDWPENLDDGFWRVLRSAIHRSGATREIASEAAFLLAEDPPDFRDKYAKALGGKIREVFKSRNPNSRPGPESDRFDAETASLECEDCGGFQPNPARGKKLPGRPTGLTTRYRRLSAVAGENPAVVFYCLCPLGRFLKHAHRQDKNSDAARRIPDLADFPELQRDEYRERPKFDIPKPAPAPFDPTRISSRIALGEIGAAPNVAKGPDGRLYTLDNGRPTWLNPPADAETVARRTET